LGLLAVLAKRQTDWIRMCKSFGASDDLAQELTQEMYVRLYKYVDDAEKIMYNETEVNTFFVYVTLRNMYATLMRQRARFEFVDVDILEEFIYEEANEDAEVQLIQLYDRVWSTQTDWHWYDKKIFALYHNTDMSIRTLADETKISARSIFNTLKNARERIQEDCQDTYQAYKEAKRLG
jgi:DNA-directed RNA polymerase specialized sigma24 family protein